MDCFTEIYPQGFMMGLKTLTQVWRSFGELLTGRGKWENGGKCSGINKHDW